MSEWPKGYSLERVATAEDGMTAAVGLVQDGVTQYHVVPIDTTPGSYLSGREAELHELSNSVYQERLRFGVAKEVARKDLPLSTFTEVYWKCDLRNVLHMLGLRMDAHAQQEIREYANVIGHELVAKLFPVTWEACVDYQLESMRLTRLDVEMIQRMVQAAGEAAAETMATEGFDKDSDAFNYMPPYSVTVFMQCQDPSWRELKKCRERVECWTKLERLRLVRRREDEPVVE